ncbi:MAG TPA: hypothetical protein V6D28_22585 [Leptolyngbyaceae cyanobacterium]
MALDIGKEWIGNQGRYSIIPTTQFLYLVWHFPADKRHHFKPSYNAKPQVDYIYKNLPNFMATLHKGV